MLIHNIMDVVVLDVGCVVCRVNGLQDLIGETMAEKRFGAYFNYYLHHWGNYFSSSSLAYSVCRKVARVIVSLIGYSILMNQVLVLWNTLTENI